MLLLLCVLGFLLLSFLGLVFSGTMGQFLPALLFMILPLAGLAWIDKRCIPAIFKPLNGRALLLIPAFTLLNLVVSIVVALVIYQFAGASANPAIGLIREFSNLEFVLFLARTLPQLIGEELVTILPFLALLSYLVRNKGWSKKSAVIVSWIVTALIFGALHLPTYEWNVAQSLVIIGSARLVLTAAYLATGNIWVSTGAHVLSDWVIFLIAFLATEIEMP